MGQLEETKPAARRKQVRAKYVADYLSSHPCLDCGEHDPVVLDFDHVHGKKECDVNALVYGWALLGEAGDRQ
jgi:hypothetical protein